MTATQADDMAAAGETEAAPRASRGRRREHAVLGTISVAAFLLFWEISVATGWANPLFTSSPTRILAAGYEAFRDGSIYNDLRVSGIEFD